MSRFLFDKSQRFEMRGPGDAPPEADPVSFHDPATAHAFLDPLSTDVWQIDAMREALAQETPFPTVHRMRDHEVVDQLAWRLHTGAVTVAPGTVLTRGTTPGDATKPAAPPEQAPADIAEAPPEEEIVVENEWIAVKLVRKAREAPPAWWPDEGTLPYAQTRYGATLTDRSTEGTLDGQGQTDYQDIPPGACAFTFTDFYDDIEQWLEERAR